MSPPFIASGTGVTATTAGVPGPDVARSAGDPPWMNGHQRMRRLIAFTILLTSGWSQYSATHCAMGLSSPPPTATASFASVAVAHPHAHGHHAQSASPASQSSASTRSAAEAPTPNRPVDTGCPLALACASAALNSASHGIAAPPPAADADIRVRTGDHEAVPLTRDPPPPRLRV